MLVKFLNQYLLKGFGDLLEKDGIYDNKHTLRMSWDKGPYRVSLYGLKKGSFVQTSLGNKEWSSLLNSFNDNNESNNVL